MNIHAHHKGRRGWDAPDHLDYMPALEPGWAGTITDVESHGANPFTRYGIRFDNGITSHGVDPRTVEFLPRDGDHN